MDTLHPPSDAPQTSGSRALTYEQRAALRAAVDQARRAKLGRGVGKWSRRQCEALNRMDGRRCKNSAAANAPFCRNHLRVLSEGRPIQLP